MFHVKPDIRLVLLFALMFAGGCSNRREDVIERYQSGAKRTVAVYEGSGSTERLIHRLRYSSDGTLVAILSNDGSISQTYADLNPELKTAHGILEFAEGNWSGEDIQFSVVDESTASVKRFGENGLGWWSAATMTINFGPDFSFTFDRIRSVSSGSDDDTLTTSALKPSDSRNSGPTTGVFFPEEPNRATMYYLGGTKELTRSAPWN